MGEQENNTSALILDVIKKQTENTLGITSSPSTTLDITIDIKEESKQERALGQMVYVLLVEDGNNILVIGQIISIETKNRWHEDPSFKGVIKRHGRLPHLSGTADNRIATISVQACYSLGKEVPEGYILGTSPSTGEKIERMNNPVMEAIMTPHENYITYMGKVYGTDVNLPFWFKHFGKTDAETNEQGAGDAYHLGVFGKTGSGKSVTAAYTLMGYAKNKNNLSILVLDPQSQFYLDQELLPNGKKLEDHIKKANMNYEKYKILTDIYLPGDRFDIFAELLKNNGFVEEAFRPIYTPEKVEAMAEAISDYLIGRANNPSFDLGTFDSRELLEQMLNRFLNTKDSQEKKDGFSKYVTQVWGTPQTRQRLVYRINYLKDNLDKENSVLEKWNSVIYLFSPNKKDGSSKKSVDYIVDAIVKKSGNFIILDIGPKQGEIENENVQALFIKILESGIVEAGSDLYAKGDKANSLIVMDEAHRFISRDSTDQRVKELTSSIINSVRTTRKYGIGYMFITQTIESLDEEILRQMRIFAFGYGLTSGQELRKISEIVNNKSATQLYKSFIDPSSNNKFPFMFFGPVSPLSFTGSPLFIEMYTDIAHFK
jgi:hypothetical protein